jgi:hypothetical protein
MVVVHTLRWAGGTCAQRGWIQRRRLHQLPSQGPLGCKLRLYQHCEYSCVVMCGHRWCIQLTGLTTLASALRITWNTSRSAIMLQCAAAGTDIDELCETTRCDSGALRFGFHYGCPIPPHRNTSPKWCLTSPNCCLTLGTVSGVTWPEQGTHPAAVGPATVGNVTHFSTQLLTRCGPHVARPHSL